MSEVREGYKMTELGEIPIDWKVIKLKDGVELLTDYTANGSFASLKENVTYFREPNYALLVRTTDLQNNNFDSGNVYTDQRGYDFLKKSALFGGELIMNNVGAGAGQVFIMPFLNKKATIAPNALVFKFNESLESKFMYHFFKSSMGKNELYKLSPTGALKNINKTLLKELVFVTPPIKEQQKISSILSAVDEQINETEQLIVKTKELKKGLMQQLLTKGIGHTEFKHTELGEIPRDWEIIKLSEVSELITKGSTPTTYGFYWEDNGICFFKSDVVKEGKFVYGDYKYISQEAHEHMARSIVRAGDILISITGNIGRVAIIPNEIEEANINQHIARIRVNKDNVNSQFIFHWLNQGKIIKYYELIKTGLAYPQISLAQVRDTLVPIPSIEEQQKIAQILSTVDEQIEVYEQEKAKYEELKKGLMQQLLTGQIRVKI